MTSHCVVEELFPLSFLLCLNDELLVLLGVFLKLLSLVFGSFQLSDSETKVVMVKSAHRCDNEEQGRESSANFKQGDRPAAGEVPLSGHVPDREGTVAVVVCILKNDYLVGHVDQHLEEGRRKQGEAVEKTRSDRITADEKKEVSDNARQPNSKGPDEDDPVEAISVAALDHHRHVEAEEADGDRTDQVHAAAQTTAAEPPVLPSQKLAHLCSSVLK